MDSRSGPHEVKLEAVRDASILIVDDSEQMGRLVERMLAEAGLRNLTRTTDSRRVVAMCTQADIDLLLLDLIMPGVDGFQILQELAPLTSAGSGPAIVVVSGEADRASRHRALELGARDYITKPFDAREVVLRVRNLLTMQLLERRLRSENWQLALAVQSASKELAQARVDAVRHLALAAEAHDDDTRAHTERVGRCSAWLADTLRLEPSFGARIRVAAPLHDVGKIGMPDRIFRKSGPLTAEEFAVMKTHTTLGGAILGNSEIPALQLAQRIALTHHERWNGTGYPNGLGGEQIDIGGRIVAVADVFDALVHVRPYKPAWTISRAVREISAQRGAQFDPAVVDAFLSLDHVRVAGGGLAAVSS